MKYIQWVKGPLQSTRKISDIHRKLIRLYAHAIKCMDWKGVLFV